MPSLTRDPITCPARQTSAVLVLPRARFAPKTAGAMSAGQAAKTPARYATAKPERCSRTRATTSAGRAGLSGAGLSRASLSRASQGRAGWGLLGQGLPGDRDAELQDQPDAAGVGEQARLGQRVPVNDDQVGELALGHRADVLTQTERLGRGPGRGDQRFGWGEPVVHHPLDLQA